MQGFPDSQAPGRRLIALSRPSSSSSLAVWALCASMMPLVLCLHGSSSFANKASRADCETVGHSRVALDCLLGLACLVLLHGDGLQQLLQERLVAAQALLVRLH